MRATWIVTAAVVAVGAGGCEAGDAPVQVFRAPLRSVAEWEALFLGVWDREHAGTYLRLSESGNGWHLYNLAYAIDAAGAMFEATGQTRYLDRGLLYAENAIRTARPSSTLPESQFKDGYLGWPSSGHPDPSIRGGEYPLFESYCWRYVTRLLRLMRQTPAVYGDPAYRRRYDAILAFTERHIFDKWASRGPAHLYRNRTHMAAHWAFIALDLWLVTEDQGRRARYREVFDNINRRLPNYDSSLRRQFRPHPRDPQAYFWSSIWGSFAPPGQDVSHGNNLIAYLVEAHQHGVEWTEADMRALVATFDRIVWPRGGGHAEYVDGSGAGNGWFNDGFCKLGRFDAALQARLETHGVGRGMQLYANGALNAKLLSSPRPDGGAPPTPPHDGALADVRPVVADASTAPSRDASDGALGADAERPPARAPDAAARAHGADAGVPPADPDFGAEVPAPATSDSAAACACDLGGAAGDRTGSVLVWAALLGWLSCRGRLRRRR